MSLPLIFLRRVVTALPYFEADLIAYLESFGFAVYPGKIPQRSALPAVSFFLIDGDSFQNLSGSSGMATGRYQFTVASTVFDESGVLNERLRRVLNRVQFQMGTRRVFSGVPGNQLTKYDPTSDAADEDGVHMKITEFTFMYAESIPTF